MEPLDSFLFPEIIETVVLTLIAIGLLTLVAFRVLRQLVRIPPSDVPAWVWTLLVFVLAWSTQYLIMPLLKP